MDKMADGHLGADCDNGENDTLYPNKLDPNYQSLV